MSTQEIRRLIDAVADSHGEGRVRLALAEVEAIERAARFITTLDTGATITQELAQQAVEAGDTLERIAKESAAQTDGTCRCPPRPYWPPGSMVSGTDIEERAHEKWEREHGSHEAEKRR